MIEVGDKVRRHFLYEDKNWLIESKATEGQILTVSYISANTIGFEEIKDYWAAGRFYKVTQVSVKDESKGKTPSDWLREAAETLDERGKQYDSTGSERSMEKTVGIFNLLTGNNLTTAEGWQFMKCLKDVRLWSQTDSVHVDSIVDNLGYTALLAEEAVTLGGKLKAEK